MSTSIRRRKEPDELDLAIAHIFPDCSPILAKEIRGEVVRFVGQGLANGYDLALIKSAGDKAKLRTLRIREQFMREEGDDL